MRFPGLVAFPLAWACAFLVLDAVFLGSSAHGTFLRTQVELVKVLALVGAWAAAFTFERGQYLRRGWFFVGAVMALLLVRDSTVIVPGAFAGLGQDGLDRLRGLLVVAANVCGVVGSWTLAHAWRVASLELPGTPAARVAVVAGAVAIAVGLAGPGIVTNARAVAGGDLARVAGAASAAGDMVNLILIAPLLFTALALRGGLIGWPWALVVASNLAWLLYDATLVLAPALGVDTRWTRTGSELFRGLGCTLGFSAGIVQRLVVTSLRSLRTRAAPATG